VFGLAAVEQRYFCNSAGESTTHVPH